MRFSVRKPASNPVFSRRFVVVGTPAGALRGWRAPTAQRLRTHTALAGTENPSPTRRTQSGPSLATKRAAQESTPASLSPAASRLRIRPGSLVPHNGWHENLVLVGTRILIRLLTTYTKICALPRSTPCHQARFCAEKAPPYVSVTRYEESASSKPYAGLPSSDQARSAGEFEHTP